MDFYHYLCLRYLEANNYLGLMESIDKLLMSNQNLKRQKEMTQTWRWTNLFVRSRQNSFFTGPYSYEFRYSLYKKLLDNKLTWGGFTLVKNYDETVLSYYDSDCCAPTVLLDLCLEALLISVSKFEEAYDLCIELIVRNTIQKLSRENVEKHFSRAFDAYIETQNQQSKKSKGFSAYQRFKNLPKPEIRLAKKKM